MMLPEGYFTMKTPFWKSISLYNVALYYIHMLVHVYIYNVLYNKPTLMIVYNTLYT
jgi:hypothetical protein